jgi:hypothetical protein
MKQYFKLLSLPLSITAFFLLFSFPANGMDMRLPEIEEEINILSEIIEDCLRDIEEPDFLLYESQSDPLECNYEGEANTLGDQLYKYLHPGDSVGISEMDRAKARELKIALDRLKEKNEDLQKRKAELKAKIERSGDSAGAASVSELAEKICALWTDVLEKQFGELMCQILSDETHIYGRVIAIDFVLPEGNILDDSWTHKVVKGLSELDMDGVRDGNSVRASGTIDGQEASHIHVTAGTVNDHKSVIGAVFRFK